jgi:hypothetical protein
MMNMTFQYLVRAVIFESGAYSILLLLFYLVGLFEISVCPKGFLFWPMVGTEKVGNSPLVPGWYREALICYYISFCHSRIVNSFWRYDN